MHKFELFGAWECITYYIFNDVICPDFPNSVDFLTNFKMDPFRPGPQFAIQAEWVKSRMKQLEDIYSEDRVSVAVLKLLALQFPLDTTLACKIYDFMMAFNNEQQKFIQPHLVLNVHPAEYRLDKDHVCGNCGQPASKFCVVCKIERYCCAKCQREHLPKHKSMCDSLKQVRERKKDASCFDPLEEMQDRLFK
ncbi:hypothetical protein FDP41_000956 [Naegleria fowleri]|uniref:MYND-type domain-containing protein n=1 Tax=Naegleria fowleri TaxID=5763 RepID=A0A6A5BP58_NAEFO|nr:uncharacterized protein FDP41_000956 [Naegleria fowleri]KAF0979803.1 hypothetical protein FDP41_000956 [Naegleria fowleri]CAG4719699.1 unnamed protein product [Naegleria fowleri]